MNETKCEDKGTSQSQIRQHLEMYFYHNYPFQISIVIVSIRKKKCYLGSSMSKTTLLMMSSGQMRR